MREFKDSITGKDDRAELPTATPDVPAATPREQDTTSTTTP